MRERPDLDALERLCEQATPGPWETYATDSRYPIYVHIQGEEFYHVATMDSQEHEQGLLAALAGPERKESAPDRLVRGARWPLDGALRA